MQQGQQWFHGSLIAQLTKHLSRSSTNAWVAIMQQGQQWFHGSLIAQLTKHLSRSTMNSWVEII